MEKQKFLVPFKFEGKAKLEHETYKKAERLMAYIVFKNCDKIENYIKQLCEEELKKLEDEANR